MSITLSSITVIKFCTVSQTYNDEFLENVLLLVYDCIIIQGIQGVSFDPRQYPEVCTQSLETPCIQVVYKLR